MYSVEWQKRGLPHAHILVWFIDKIRPEEIDSIISAEIPDPSTDQLLFDIVTTNMIHGPCGTFNSSSPCMADGKCTKNFPKDFTNDTVTNVDGYPIYRRRNPENGGQSFIKNIINTDIDIDNRWVVPYSPLLSKTYNAHINVEFCSSVKSIKYICKYVHKGSDMAVFRVENTNVNAPPVNKNDEITLYQIGRYISSNEAAWRIFGFPIHERDPAVVQLAIHLENVNPRHTECFYLRLLLVNVTGPLSFQDIRKVNGQQYPTYKDACLALGLLEDDNQWECMLAEAALNCTAIQIRLLFAIVLTTCFPARAQILWENHKDSMTDDILHQHRIRCHDLTITFSDEMYNEALIAIEDLCIVIANLPLSNFGMNSPNRTASDLMNTEMNRELQYSTVEMAAIVARNVPLMNEEQRTIYDRIMLAVSAGQGDFRQTLPVIPRSTYADEINACLKSSPLWRNVEKLQLKINMRVQMLQDPSAETFSKQLLDIGDGKVAIDETGYVKLPTDFCTIADSQDTLIEQIFPDVHTQYINHEWLAERAILAAKNVDVDNLNLKIQMLLPGNLVSYKSIDTVCDDSEAVNFPTEFLNSLDLPGMPPHNLQLKKSEGKGPEAHADNASFRSTLRERPPHAGRRPRRLLRAAPVVRRAPGSYHVAEEDECTRAGGCAAQRAACAGAGAGAAVEARAGSARARNAAGGMDSPQMYDAGGAPPPPPQPDLKKVAEDKRAPFPPPDLDELNGPEISLDLQHLIEDQFRNEETMTLFQEILPGGRSPQPRPFARTTLAYMPQPVHSGAAYAPTQQHDAPPIKEEPPEPHDFRRACAQFPGAPGGGAGAGANTVPHAQYAGAVSAVGPGGPYGGFAPLPPLGAPLLPPLLKHKPPRLAVPRAKVRSREVEEKVKTLLREKEALLKRLEAVSGELSLHKQMYVHLINLNHPEITELCRSMLQLGAPHGSDHTL
ncbi:hypothetical protein EVAR_73783_1 [Eumeta japonica]|uniref:ATP-dependent DNA helicase n=3 Tax=Eumeta variegata TaxID=151549 RepID=A0A4C1ZYF2_EUMVA|nr:hypothetical protein EVAR_73783_1 [Eumeta japonica]